MASEPRTFEEIMDKNTPLLISLCVIMSFLNTIFYNDDLEDVRTFCTFQLDTQSTVLLNKTALFGLARVIVFLAQISLLPSFER